MEEPEVFPFEPHLWFASVFARFGIRQRGGLCVLDELDMDQLRVYLGSLITNSLEVYLESGAFFSLPCLGPFAAVDRRRESNLRKPRFCSSLPGTNFLYRGTIQHCQKQGQIGCYGHSPLYAQAVPEPYLSLITGTSRKVGD